MKNIYMFLIILFIFISCSNVCASDFQSDIGMANPIGNLETGQKWLEDDASTKTCSEAERDYNFCLNNHNKFDLGNDCYSVKMALKSCWDDYWEEKRIERCNQNRIKFYSALHDEGYYLCRKILEKNQDCNNWYKYASTALYNATKRPDFQSISNQRPQRPTCPPGTKESSYDSSKCYVVSTLSPYGMTKCTGQYIGFELTNGGRCAEYVLKK